MSKTMSWSKVYQMEGVYSVFDGHFGASNPSVFGWLLTMFLLTTTWLLSTALRAIIGEKFKRWYFTPRDARLAKKQQWLKEKEFQLQLQEEQLANERLALEGKILRAWRENDAWLLAQQGRKRGS